MKAQYNINISFKFKSIFKKDTIVDFLNVLCQDNIITDFNVKSLHIKNNDEIIKLIQNIVLKYMNSKLKQSYTKQQFLQPYGKNGIALLRQFSMSLCYEFTTENLYSIAAHHGLTNHTTVLHALQTIKNRRDTNKKISEHWNYLTNKIEKEL